MRVLAFGSLNDRQAWDVVDKIKDDFPGIKFLKTGTVDAILAFDEDIVVMDAVKGIDKPCLLGIDDLRERRLNTLHDFDAGFFLKLMKKIGKINKLKIIGIPMRIDDKTIKDIKKLL
ncbi:MAG: hypothetical protein NT129_05410 [Candidatus Aenigmarchaeota archaeon]|nr:hypothetical protein [Candidatus Aenigmarchaeota archaeon]